MCQKARARFRRPSPTSAKSAMRGSLSSLVLRQFARPFATASSSTPRMRGRSASNAAHISCSGRRRSSEIGSSVRNTARSARSGRVTMSSMPLRITGREARTALLLIGVELAHRETAARGEPAERVGNPGGQARHVVEGEHMAVAGRDEQVAILARQGPKRRGVGIEQRPQDRRECRFRRPCSPDRTITG